MASPELDPVISIAPLIPGASTIDQKTITIYVQLAFSAGYYTVGGIPAGIQAYAGTLTINDSQFLWGDVRSEEPFTTSLGIGGYNYKYNPLNDTIQIFDGPIATGYELTASQAIPAGVLNDVIIGRFTWNRLAQ